MADSPREEIVAVRAEPRDDAEQVTQVLRGEPVTVEERVDGWVRIRTAYDYPGWVREEALGGEADPAWMAGDGADPVEQRAPYLGTPYLWGGMTERGHRLLRARAHGLSPEPAGSSRATPHQQEAAGEEVAEGRPAPRRPASATRATSRSGSATAASSTRPSARA